MADASIDSQDKGGKEETHQVFSRRGPIDNQIPTSILYHVLPVFHNGQQMQYALHTLLTDAVYSHGGTTELVQVMNRLGMISSEDTHARYVDHVVRHSDNTHDIDLSDTVVATLDNLDFLQSNAAVYCGDQHRSWHGTTVQILQPKPPTQPASESVSSRNTATSRSLPPTQKKERRSRTAKERKTIGDNDVRSLGSSSEEPPTSRPSSLIIEGKTIKDFLVDDEEKQRADHFTQQAFRYISDRVEKTETRGLQEYLRLDEGVSVQEKTAYRYFDILDTLSESKDTLQAALAKLHTDLKVGEELNHVLVVVDAKIYPVLQAIKHEDPDTYSWLIPFPGDFHLLMNYQKVLMKIYWDAGLKQIAEASGFRGETLASLEHCSNSTNTSNFLFQVWEALFQHMYLEWQHSTPQPYNTSPSMTQLDNFQAFLDKKAAEDDNWKFWGDSVMKNCLPYISLYISVRSSDWILCVVTIKSMVPTFAAYDRPHYHHLIP